MKTNFLPFAFLTLLAPVVFAQDYEIRIERPHKAGDQFKVSSTTKMSQSSSQTFNDGAPQGGTREYTVQFEGVEKVLEVDAQGRETKATLTVSKFTMTEAGVSRDLADKGTIINCSVADNKPVYDIDGAKPMMGITLKQALLGVIEMGHGQPTDDELFGTKERKKKGDSWDINAGLAKTAFAQEAEGAELTEISGKTTVDDVAGDNLKISAHTKGKFKPPLPPQVIVDDATIEQVFGGTFPIDVTKLDPVETAELTISFTAHGEGAKGKVVLQNKMVQSISHSESPVSN